MTYCNSYHLRTLLASTLLATAAAQTFYLIHLNDGIPAPLEVTSDVNQSNVSCDWGSKSIQVTADTTSKTDVAVHTLSHPSNISMLSFYFYVWKQDSGGGVRLFNSMGRQELAIGVKRHNFWSPGLVLEDSSGLHVGVEGSMNVKFIRSWTLVNATFDWEQRLYNVRWEHSTSGNVIFTYSGLLMEGRNVNEIRWSNFDVDTVSPSVEGWTSQGPMYMRICALHYSTKVLTPILLQTSTPSASRTSASPPVATQSTSSRVMITRKKLPVQRPRRLVEQRPSGKRRRG